MIDPLGLIFDQLNHYISWKNQEGKFLGCNKKFLNLYGLDHEKQLINKSYFSFFEGSIANTLNNNDLKVLTKGETIVFIENLEFKNKKHVLLSYKTPLFCFNNIIRGVITESADYISVSSFQGYNLYDKIALNSIVRDLPGHIYWKDKNGKYLGCNDKQAYSLGFKSGTDIIGKTDRDLPWGEHVSQKFRDNDLLVMNTGRTEVVEERVTINNRPHTVLSQKSPLKGSDGITLGVLGVSVDITKQKLLEKYYASKVLELEKALETKKAFLNNASHEIRTPLHVISNILEEVKKNWEILLEEDKKNYINIAITNQNRLMSLLSNVLDLGKAQSGRLMCVFKDNDLLIIIKDVISEFHFSKAKISITNFPAHTALYCDQERLKQVFRNLISNSIKYGCGNNNKIDINIYDCSQYFKIIISDRGIGIPQNELEKIFEPFYESSITETKSGGTGLGLSICKSIISEHTGKIYAKSKINQGTKMIIEIPKQEKKKKHILMIDDDSSILDSTHLMLKYSDYKLTTVDSGQAAIEFFKKGIKLDLILLDMLMHDIYGTEVLKESKKYESVKNVPVIIQTGITDEGFIKEALNLGAKKVLHKPYSGRELKACFEEFLKN